LLEEAASFQTARYAHVTGAVEWSCPSNIALIKYWGKRPVQIPMNPSLSVTLEAARTITGIRFDYDPSTSSPTFRFLFESREAPSFGERVRRYMKDLHPYLPFLAHTSVEIESRNTFPHSSGIASSASAMGAMALCLLQMEHEVTGEEPGMPCLQKASFLARLGSGSASRSLFPDFSVWGHAGDFPGSSDEFAIPFSGFHPAFSELKDAILIVQKGEKAVSSSAGHAIMDRNPFARVRFTQARENLGKLKESLEKGDWEQLIVLMEGEALTLHAMMMTGTPGYLLLQPGTLSILHKIRLFREETGARIGFTLDAGANVHVIYDGRESEKAEPFIQSELTVHCENGMVIRDRIGKGPVQS